MKPRFSLSTFEAKIAFSSSELMYSELTGQNGNSCKSGETVRPLEQATFVSSLSERWLVQASLSRTLSKAASSTNTISTFKERHLAAYRKRKLLASGRLRDSSVARCPCSKKSPMLLTSIWVEIDLKYRWLWRWAEVKSWAVLRAFAVWLK